MASEAIAFAAARPKSQALAALSRQHFPGGVPLHWMLDWDTPFPLSVVSARGATIEDADGIRYADFCLGDSGALFGHSPPAIADAIAAQAARGLTAMLPGSDVADVGKLLSERFGLAFWQVTATASDANRNVIRWARAITGRSKIMVFDGGYHGQVDDTFVRLSEGMTVLQAGLVGQVQDLATHTVSAPFNDLAAIEGLLAAGDIALILTEPALTNTAMVLPEAGFIEQLIGLARRHGTLVCLDETHTIATALGGHTGHGRLDPDFFVLGKPIAGGLPAAVYGFTPEIEDGMRRVLAQKPAGYSGIGTTLSGNLLAMAAIRACLSRVMTEEAYSHMLRLAQGLADGLERAVAARRLPWSIARLGARVELIFSPKPLRNGAEARQAIDHTIERALHFYLLNRGILLTPFHNMMLISPATTEDDVLRLIKLMDEAFGVLLAGEGSSTT